MKFQIASLATGAVVALGLTVGSVSTRAAQDDIATTAAGAGQFRTLPTALEAADLVYTLKGSGPFTVFAPTDAAFAKRPGGTVKNLMRPENKEELVAILTYQVVPSRVMAADVVEMDEAKTVNGKMRNIKKEGDAVMVSDAKVNSTDIAASNGVIHVVDTGSCRRRAKL